VSYTILNLVATAQAIAQENLTPPFTTSNFMIFFMNETMMLGFVTWLENFIMNILGTQESSKIL